MAVTITALELRFELLEDRQARSAPGPLVKRIDRIYEIARARVEQVTVTEDCPDEAQNEALIRYAAYIYPSSGNIRRRAELAPPAAWRLSGAGAVLAPWRVHRAGKI